jgi:hypothetical protein
MFRIPILPALVVLGFGALTVACGSGAGAGASASSPASAGTATASPSVVAGATGSPTSSVDPNPQEVFTPVPDASQGPDSGAATAAGDIPDNAVFLTYTSAAWQFSIPYVEGWQVATQGDGVTIRDKDSSETVVVVQRPADIQNWVKTVDLPSLQATPGFSLVKEDNVKIGAATYLHLVYHAPAAPDPVTGKQVPSTIDRFYVPGPGLAVISLSTPDGVDNVDAFRHMIESFTWHTA